MKLTRKDGLSEAALDHRQAAQQKPESRPLVSNSDTATVYCEIMPKEWAGEDYSDFEHLDRSNPDDIIPHSFLFAVAIDESGKRAIEEFGVPLLVGEVNASSIPERLGHAIMVLHVGEFDNLMSLAKLPDVEGNIGISTSQESVDSLNGETLNTAPNYAALIMTGARSGQEYSPRAASATIFSIASSILRPGMCGVDVADVNRALHIGSQRPKGIMVGQAYTRFQRLMPSERPGNAFYGSIRALDSEPWFTHCKSLFGCLFGSEIETNELFAMEEAICHTIKSPSEGMLHGMQSHASELSINYVLIAFGFR